MPMVWVFLSLLLHGTFKWEIPVKLAAFRAFCHSFMGILIVMLVHRSISHGVAQAIYLLSLDSSYRVLLSIWHMALPIGMFAYYASAKRKTHFPDLVLIGALFLSIYIVETHALFTIISQYDVGWVNLQGDRDSFGVGLAIQVFRALLIYALISIGEELFFRVTLFEVLQKLFRFRETATVLVIGLIFGVLHIGPYFTTEVELVRIATLYNVVTTTLLGLALGFIYARHKDLLLISFLHWWVWVMNIGGRMMAGLLYLWLS